MWPLQTRFCSFHPGSRLLQPLNWWFLFSVGDASRSRSTLLSPLSSRRPAAFAPSLLIQYTLGTALGGALANFLARGAFCSCCPLPFLPPTPKASFSAHALSASSLTYFSLSATAPRPLSSPRRQQRRRQWKKNCTLAASTWRVWCVCLRLCARLRVPSALSGLLGYYRHSCHHRLGVLIDSGPLNDNW